MTTPRRPELRMNDRCLAFVVGPWAGFGYVEMKGVRVRGFNLGWLGLRWWHGDLPSKIVVEVTRLAQATQGVSVDE